MRRSIGVGLLLAGIAVAVLAWSMSGWSYAVLASPSMEPWASSGDLLLHRHVPASEIETGDVVTVPLGDDRLVTHRVVRLDGTGEGRVARLKGDRSRLADPLPVDLRGDVARVDAVVPGLGHVLTFGAPLLWGGIVLLAVGAGALSLSRRSGTAAGGPPEDEPSAAGPDPRIEALLVTCEQLAEDGVADLVLRDVLRVRLAAVTGLPSAERAGAVLELDDGARFYVIACADADVGALALVPVGSRRQRDATAALDRWWQAVEDRLPSPAADALATWSTGR